MPSADDPTAVLARVQKEIYNACRQNVYYVNATTDKSSALLLLQCKRVLFYFGLDEKPMSESKHWLHILII